MARYIDIEGAGIGKANREQFLVPEFADGWNAVLKILENEPTADVAEVKHGHWIKTDRGIRKSINTGQPMRVYAVDCSCCGYHTGNQGTEFNYCPNCGAKMDGAKEE